MKNTILLCIVFLFYLNVISQTTLPTGTELIDGSTVGISFLLKDKNGILWKGGGGMNLVGTRLSKGLSQFKNITWTSSYISGNFTDALESGDSIFFTADDGLYAFDGTRFSVNYLSNNNTCIVKYQGKMVVGSFGDGLYVQSSSGFKRLQVSINGRAYDSIYSIAAHDNELWIGTTNGLIKYDGTNFIKYDLPVHPSGNPLILANQKCVISIQKDRDGKVWVLNRNREDSIECLYFLQNGVFTKAVQYYADQCITKVLLPVQSSKLALNNYGQLLVGMKWGVLQLENNSIKSYQLITGEYGFSKYTDYTIAYCDKDGKLYNSKFKDGIIKIDPVTYSNSMFQNSGFVNHNTIDINDIKSSVTNTGINFDYLNRSNPTLNMPGFSVPNMGCATPMFTAALWMGGTESGNGDLHLAAETYRQTGIDFKPGPIDLVTFTYDSVANSPYNKIWKINRETIDEFKLKWDQPSYVIPKEILYWPAHGAGNFSKNLAPFVDFDQNGTYEPAKGDYPLIKGDQMLWWVFNDLGAHTETGGQPLGVEVHGSCYAYYYRDMPVTDTNYIVNRTIMFDYKIINRSQNDYENFYTSIFNDVDLGNYADDYVGCDVLQNAGYGCNGDNYDEGPYGYGLNPPAIFCKVMNRSMTGFIYYNNDQNPINGNPNSPNDYYNYMQSISYDGSDFTYYGVKTKYFSDNGTNPATAHLPCWNQKSSGISPSDRRFLMSTGNVTFKKDSIFEVEFAYILNDSVARTCHKSTPVLSRVQNWYDKKSFPSRPYYGAKVQPVQSQKHGFIVYPNPGNTIVNIKSDIESKSVKSIEIMDHTGKVVYQSQAGNNNEMFTAIININSLSSGIYLVKINSANGALVERFVKE